MEGWQFYRGGCQTSKLLGVPGTAAENEKRMAHIAFNFWIFRDSLQRLNFRVLELHLIPVWTQCYNLCICKNLLPQRSTNDSCMSTLLWQMFLQDFTPWDMTLHFCELAYSAELYAKRLHKAKTNCDRVCQTPLMTGDQKERYWNIGRL